MPISLRFDELRRAYRAGRLTPVDVAAHVLETLRARGDDHVWTALADPASIMQRARELAARADSMDQLPLYGLPFGVKDNVDVARMPTACGCPGFARIAESDATAVRKALDAGALFIGKQSLDQFATGLNGTRALGGFCRNTFNADIIPGGSSTGSGVSVAAGLVSFALGSDTGGSGRIPAALNNIVGLRPSVGLVGSRGMVYNNRLFDCMPIFAPTVADAASVLRVIAGPDDDDPIARISGGPAWSLEATFPSTFVFAVPDALEFFGDHRSAQAFDDAVRRLESLGGTRTTLPFAPFREAGSMVFESALVAERAASYGRVLEDNPDELVPAVASILRRAREYSAVEAFQTLYRLSELRGELRSSLQGIDVLVTPTVPRAFTLSEMLAEPIERNNQVGHYTYGVGPLDLCALAVPAAIRSDGIPFGISLVGRAGEDGRLIALGERFQASVGIPPGIEALA